MLMTPEPEPLCSTSSSLKLPIAIKAIFQLSFNHLSEV